MRPLRGAVLALALLAACSSPAPPAGPAPAPAPAPAPEPAPPAAPAAPEVPTAPEAGDPVAPPPPLAAHDPALVNFDGFGTARFGASEAEVRMAWGRSLFADVPDEAGGCYLLVQDPRPEQGYGLAFMMEGERMLRYDVDTPAIGAPGGLGVGAEADAVLAAFPGRVETQPGKYDPATRTLTVTPADGGAARLVFEVDAGGKVRSWRIGLPPQVHYVEGCS